LSEKRKEKRKEGRRLSLLYTGVDNSYIQEPTVRELK
jgi:hypothetical protein